MAQDLAALTNTWMTNPYMFEPSQLSNPYSNYKGAALPWPPIYNTGLAGGPVNAATGQPIQSFQQWQQQNPGGLSLNATPAAPAAAPQPTGSPYDQRMQAMGVLPGAGGYAQDPARQAQINPGPSAYYAAGNSGSPSQYGQTPMVPFAQSSGAVASGGGPAAAPQAQASGPPNNWQAAINALANPGNPVTQGANVPQMTGSQPAGGVNQSFLNQAGAGAGMNQNFLSALRAIQARPQQ